MNSNEHNTTVEEIMAKINEIQQELRSNDTPPSVSQTENRQESKATVLDEDLFDQILNSRGSSAKPNQKSALRRLLDEEEDENDEGDEYQRDMALYDDIPEDIEEFENEDERDEIYRDLKNTVGKMAAKGFLFLILSLASLYLFACGFYPVLFGGNTNSIFFGVALLLIDGLCIFLSYNIFGQGLAKLVRAKADTDTLLALLSIFVTIVRVVEMIKPVIIPYTLILEPCLSIGLYFNILAKKKIAINIKNNFKLASMNGDKLTVSIPASCETVNDLILETGEGGEVMFAHRTELLSGYIDHSFSDYDWSDKLHHFYFAGIVAVLVGTIVVFQLVGLGAGLLFPAASFALSIPFFSRYYYALSIYKNGKAIRKKGGMLTSANSAKELEDGDMIVIAEEDFLEDDAVLLQGVKTIGDIQIDNLILNIAALFNHVGTPLKSLFLKMVDRDSIELPRVDDVYYHKGLGYSCLIHSKMFLVGNKEFMRQFNIEIPEELSNLKLKEFRYPVYVSYHKSAVGVFIASFERSKRTADMIDLAAKECVSIGIVSDDFLFDKELLRKLYPSLPAGLFHFISHRTGEACEKFLKRKEKSADLIASINGPKGLVGSLYGASKLLSALKINTVIRIVYTIIAIALIFFIALAGYSANTALQILAFQFIWYLPVWIVCAFCK